MSFVPWLCVLIGLYFLLLPDLVVRGLSLVIGGLCIAFGIWKIVSCLLFSRTSLGNFGTVGSLIGGGAVLFLGIYIITHAERVFALLPIAAGIFFLLDGLDRIRSAFAIRRMNKNAARLRPASENRLHSRRFLTTVLIGILTLGIGIFLLCYPFGAVRMTVRIIGILILADAVGALWTAHALKELFRTAETETGTHAPDGKYNASFRDISDEV